MNSKKWCVIVACATVLAVVAIMALNIFVDPFGVFGDRWYSYNATNNPRVAKIEYLEKNHHLYDSYLVGCSSTSSFPVGDLNRYLDAKFYNTIMYGADMYDAEQTIYYLSKNYTVKNILLNIYIANGFDYNFEPDKMTGSMHASVSGENKASFYKRYLFANPQYSFAKIEASFKDKYLAESFDVFDEKTGAYDKKKRDAEHISDMEEYYRAYPVFANYPKGEYPLTKYSENAESLARIKEFCEANGINLIIVNAPIYYEYFTCIPKEDIKRFYKEIAEKVDFWDFSVSSVSLEPRYFYDETHFRNDVGSMALARVFGDDSVYIPEDFGVYVTKENVDAHIESFWGRVFTDKSYTKKLPVLLYHHISEDVENDMMVSPKRFEEHMKVIYENGYTAVTLDDITDYIKKGKDLPERSVLITFDDGYMSNYNYAYPILSKYGLHAVIFAVGETFGKDVYPDTEIPIYPHFGEKEMREMENSGVIEVESHTYSNHQNASYEEGKAYENILIKPGEKDTDYVLRIKDDLKSFKQRLGKEEIKALAFPHGLSDLLSQAVLNEEGVDLSFSTNFKTDTLIKGLSSSGYNIGRYTVTEEMTGEDILNLINE